ncbi:unnamed protein product [Effrenium voratum]|uniref:Eukaryotic translation initiation factor 3 subunit G n=1 Tax=Effrenium voratum TaxID=2562239 RepID=A0AA36MK72_9DINO|nr:unnamed protein product [Effrenium voratum]CAJ1370648.1 unnamed protein product [Effrenium voratum]CAJ1425931.1 unnamed protein product [Effrenium voratum]|mmetsp:Transcript_1342/g.3147  ORF Transcript_1342/g.3147 Transcript_1342/m.3147 type:complete len:286 (-) Transcript_1342:160-1017(-)|eukprot:CAMPEP_0181467502 /NCGR_PEP_ID=MMETSP1110-20121109/37014_1 /TAXON_ID=174948 /ORGANISM="Symbiodinium sp., Strain CCMP421" /LENGTH=285 /DNA_ID=CAMNT_0023592335 /DNA_START=73 /DNA_END=930 /DNA_ORIENTATION=+
MSTTRWGKKWADFDDEDEGAAQEAEGGGFQSQADKDGIKTNVVYVEKNGATYRVTKKIKETVTTKWTNQSIQSRKNLAKFGKALTNTEEVEKTFCMKTLEDIQVESAKKIHVDLSQKDDAEEKFFEESLAITESLLREKKVWTDLNKELKEVGVGEEDKKETTDTPALATGAPGKYVPPSLRGAQAGDSKGKGKGKGGDSGQQDATLRVFNLSDDVKEGDLQDLFGQCGRLQRVFLAKDMTTFQSKGFAFITYYNKEDAQRAIDRLNGHGYDNLIMKVEWAKPRA